MPGNGDCPGDMGQQYQLLAGYDIKSWLCPSTLRAVLIMSFKLCKPQFPSPGGSDGEKSACSAGDPGSIPESERSPGEGNGNPLQYSRLENPMDRGAWQATVRGTTKSRAQLSD